MPRAALRPVSAASFEEEPRSGPQKRTLPRFYTTEEVSDSLSVSPRTVSRWIEREELIAHEFGRSVRIADDDLRAFLARRRRRR